jgi:hypothetical protein
MKRPGLAFLVIVLSILRPFAVEAQQAYRIGFLPESGAWGL